MNDWEGLVFDLSPAIILSMVYKDVYVINSCFLNEVKLSCFMREKKRNIYKHSLFA